MAVTTPFLFLGGSSILDLINTELVLAGDRRDLLQSVEDLHRWLSEVPDPRLSKDGARAHRSREVFERVRNLRNHLRRTALHLAEGGTLRPSDLAPVNEELRRVHGHLFVAVNGQPSTDFRPNAAPEAAFFIARAAAEFFTTADLSLVRRCEGESCILLFLDTTKSHTRRWCSMAWCGNRAKAAAFYERHRAAKGSRS